MYKSLLSMIALEDENTSGKISPEIEFVVYGIMTNPNKLQKASNVIKQIQASRKGVIPGSQIRVRKAINLDPRTYKPLGEPQYILTGKAPSNEHDGLDEVSNNTTEDMLNVFLAVAGEYMEKTRYVLPENRIEHATKWEVDVFYDDDNKPVEWVKIDLEVSNTEVQTLDVLPDLGLEQVIIVRAGVYKNKEEQDFVTKLYSDYFITKYKA